MVCTSSLAVALLFVSAAFPATGRSLETGNKPLRELHQSSACPLGCAEPTGCLQDSTSGGLRCNACLGSLMVRSSGLCGCTPGSYYSDEFTCSPCEKGSYCRGGDLTATAQPLKVQCPESMTTLGGRATSVLQCVNLPGHSYTQGNSTGSLPVATRCPENTWSAGLRKQRQCVSCAPGYTTGGVTGATASSACFVAAGWYTPPGSYGATACPQGTYKASAGASVNCTHCAPGVTTAGVGSTAPDNCSIVEPGVYPIAMQGTAVTSVRYCPQKYFCPGGVPQGPVNPASLSSLPLDEPTIQACPDGTWTIGLGAASGEECATPPGFFTANGSTNLCPEGSFRDEWAPSDQAVACSSCGEGVFSSRTDTLDVIDPVTQEVSWINIMTDPSGCYIKPGQGLYMAEVDGEPVYRARNCDDNSYGISGTMYGLTPYACRSCPGGMVASNDSTNYPNSASHYVNNGDGTGGFVSVKACVTKAGYGYNSRRAWPCAQGYYNDKDSYKSCSMCRYGYTTAGVGAGFTAADCKLAPGFGVHGGMVQRCPYGTFSEALRNESAPCDRCPQGTSTYQDGATSSDDCNVCAAGYGGDDCSTTCGGVGTAATYGPPLQPKGTPCRACTAAKTGYSFHFMNTNDVFAPRPIARIGANMSGDCLSEFLQVQEHAWYLPYSGSGAETVTGVANFAACAALCQENCQFLTYDYRKQTCLLKKYTPPVLQGAPFIAFKTENSGDVTASSRARAARLRASLAGNTTTVGAKALSSGQYVVYQDADAKAIGIQSASPWLSGSSTIEDCFLACDFDNNCAAVVIDELVDVAARASTCRLVKGDASVGVFKRSMTRVDLARLGAHSALLQ